MDELRVELIDGRWYIVGPFTSAVRANWNSYAHKQSANRALKRAIQRRQHSYCSTCGDTYREMQARPGCPIDSINCGSRRFFPSKPLPEVTVRVGTMIYITGAARLYQVTPSGADITRDVAWVQAVKTLLEVPQPAATPLHFGNLAA